MNVVLRKATHADAVAIVPMLRTRDFDRLVELGDPTQAVLDGLNNSIMSFAGEIDGELAALWGARCVSVLDDRAYIWVLGTILIDDHPLVFARHSRRALRSLTHHFRQVYGEIECDFELSVRWLTWLGARIAPHDDKLIFQL